MRPIRSIREWFNSRSGAHRGRRDLAVAALRCIANGWPVLPGAWWSEAANRHMCDIPGCLSAALHPAAIEQNIVAPLIPPRNLADYALTRRRDVLDRWSKHAYAVLIPTGIACDAIEIPSAYLDRVVMAPQVTRQAGPIAQVGAASYFFVSPTTTLTEPTIADLAAGKILIHRRGSWVPIPPSIVEGTCAEWIRTPTSTNWHLPSADALIPTMLAVTNPY